MDADCLGLQGTEYEAVSPHKAAAGMYQPVSLTSISSIYGIVIILFVFTDILKK